jgi:hypothetical protein
MLKAPQVYSHSTSDIRNQAFLGILGALMLIGVGVYDKNYWVIVALGIAGIAFGILHSSRLKTIISDDGISTRNIFGEKNLRWSEISRVSGRGNEIKLHNLDGDVTLAPSIELAGYEEVIETIGQKRPDLFSAFQLPSIKKSAEYAIILPLIGALVIALGIFLWLEEGDIAILPLVILSILGVVVFGISAYQPRSVQVEGSSLRIKYLLSEKTVSAADIRFVKLGFTRARNGKNYLIQFDLISGKPLRISGLSPSLPIVYLVLKKWHGENSAIGQATQRN